MNSIFESYNPRRKNNLTRHDLAFRCLHEHKVKQKIRQIHTRAIAWKLYLLSLLPTVNKQMSNAIEPYTCYIGIFLEVFSKVMRSTGSL